MASYELRTGDSYPPIPVLLTDSSSAPGIDLTNATHVVFELKGTTAALITGYCTVQQVTITGTFNATTTVSSVSPTTGYANNATIYSTAAGVGSGVTIASGAGTSTLTLSSAASGTGTFTAIVNVGLVWIPLSGANSVSTATGGVGFITADTYTGECEIEWASGGVQTVPNAKNADFTVIVDTDEESG